MDFSLANVQLFQNTQKKYFCSAVALEKRDIFAKIYLEISKL